MKKIGKMLIYTLLAAVAIYLLAWLILGVSGRSREKKAIVQWRAAGYKDPDALLAAYPPSPENDAAKQLEARVAALGIRLSPPAQDRNLPTAAAEKEYGALDAMTDPADAEGKKKLSFSDWLEVQLATPPGDPARVPAPLAAYLDGHAGDLQAVMTQLATGDKADWGVKLTMLAPLPNLLGIMKLSKVLNAQAIRKLQTGDGAAAEAALEADWRLVEILNRNPVLVCALMRMAILRNMLPLIRQLPSPSQNWTGRLAALPMQQAFADSLAAEAMMMPLSERDENAKKMMRGDVGPVLRPLADSLFMNLGAESSEHLLQVANHYNAMNGCAAADEKPSERVALEKNQPAGPYSRMINLDLTANIGSAMRQYHRLSLETEMTRLVLSQRAAKTADPTGHWPAALAEAESKVCPGQHWNWSVSPDGAASLGFSRGVEWEDLKGYNSAYEFKALN